MYKYEMEVEGREGAEELFEEGFRETGDKLLDMVVGQLVENAEDVWEEAQSANDAVRGTVNATRAEMGEYVSEVMSAAEQMQACLDSVRCSLETQATYYQMTQADYLADFMDSVAFELAALRADLRK